MGCMVSRPNRLLQRSITMSLINKIQEQDSVSKNDFTFRCLNKLFQCSRKICKFSAFSLKIHFSDTRIFFFSHSSSEQFWKQNTIISKSSLQLQNFGSFTSIALKCLGLVLDGVYCYVCKHSWCGDFNVHLTWFVSKRKQFQINTT